MAFPDGWKWVLPVTVPAEKVGAGGDISSIVLLTPSNLPSLIYTDGANSALNGGGDIRITADSSGSILLPLDVGRFVIDGAVRLFARVTVTDSGPTTFYIWWGSDGQSQPSPSSPFGRNAVWESDVEAAFVFTEDPIGSSPQLVDHTGRGYDGTNGGGVITQSNNGWVFGGGTGGGYSILNGQLPSPASTQWTIQSSFSNTSAGIILSALRAPGPSQEHQILWNDSPGMIEMGMRNAASFSAGVSTIDGSANPTVNTFQRNSGTMSLYKAGSLASSNTRPGGTYSVGLDTTVGAQYDTTGIIDTNARWNGEINLLLYANTLLSQQWITTFYNAFADPGTFAVPGTPRRMGSIPYWKRTSQVIGAGR